MSGLQQMPSFDLTAMRFPERFRQPSPGTRLESGPGDDFGFFRIPPQKTGKTTRTRALKVIASAGSAALGVPWEHVSVSLENSRACQSWEEMCLVKDLFWEPMACVIQFHPPASDYVNTHEGCLHLWRPTELEIPRPPTIAV